MKASTLADIMSATKADISQGQLQSQTPLLIEVLKSELNLINAKCKMECVDVQIEKIQCNSVTLISSSTTLREDSKRRIGKFLGEAHRISGLKNIYSHIYSPPSSVLFLKNLLRAPK